MILLILLVFALAIGVLALAVVWGTNLVLSKMVGEKHQALEVIVNTGEVPRRWSEPFDKRIARLGQDPRNAGKVDDVQAKATRQYLKKLRGLARYVETSPLIEGEDTRQLLLDRLADAGTAWQSQDSAR